MDLVVVGDTTAGSARVREGWLPNPEAAMRLRMTYTFSLGVCCC